MKRLFLSSVASMLIAVCVYAQEAVTLDSPVLVDPGATRFRVVILHLDWLSQGITIGLQQVLPPNEDGSINKTGKHVTCTYSGAEAITLMNALNKANLSTKSLQKRIIEKLQTDGKLGTGTISGTPE